MAQLPDGTHMLANVHWRRREETEGLRPLWGFTTGTLSVTGGTAAVEARFNDQSLSNRISDLEEDGVPVALQVTLLSMNEVYLLPAGAPTLERAGSCYVLRAEGTVDRAAAVHAS